jgi:hypothetical protein
MNTSLVCEGTEPGDRVVERRVDLDCLGHHILDLTTRASGSYPKYIGRGLLTSLIIGSLYLLLT